QAMQFLTDRLPIASDFRSCFKKECLQGFVELSNGLVFIDSDVALQAFDDCLCGSRNGICEFRLATSRRSFDQKRPAHLGRQKDDRQDRLINDVFGGEQPIRKVSRRREHGPRSTEKLERLEAPSLCMRVFRQIFCLEILIPCMDLLRQLRSEIERRALRSGGWPIGNSDRAGIETTCYALIALGGDQEPTRQKAIDVLLRTQNSDGSWPAFEGDDLEGCWTTAIATITLRFAQSPMAPIEKALHWLLV